MFVFPVVYLNKKCFMFVFPVVYLNKKMLYVCISSGVSQ